MRKQPGRGHALLPVTRAVLCAVTLGGALQATWVLASTSAPPTPAGAPAPSVGAPAATCSGSEGDVRVSRDGQAWGGLPKGDPVRAGERVRTGRTSAARLELAQGGALLLTEDTTLQLQPGQGGRVAVRLEAGELHGELGPGASAPTLELATPEGARARLAPVGDGPARFRLVPFQGGIDVAILSGKARLTPEPPAPGGPHDLDAGTHAVLSRSSLTPQPLLPPPAFTAPSGDVRFFCPGLVVGLGWEGVAGASAYRVEVGRDERFAPAVFSEATARTRSLFVAPVPARYLLRVTARDAQGLPGQPSAPVPLFCEPSPPEEHLLLPGPDAVLRTPVVPVPRTELRWTPLEGAARYRVAVSRGTDLHAPEAKVFTATEPRLEVEGLDEGAYLWGVWAEDSGQPLFLEPRRFTVKKVLTERVKVPSTLRNWGE